MDSCAAILVLILQAVISAQTDDSPVVSLPDGQIRGAIYKYEAITYYGFQGIPYAKPPIGDLRFEPPQRPDPWIGIRNVTSDAPSCLGTTSVPVSEDCLYVNVYTPNLQPPKKLPVIFFIYGAGFIGGDSLKIHQGPDYFMSENVIIVSLNYRTSVFGFICTGDQVYPGNVGLKDQNLALKWTHENIKHFGGDPKKITLFGNSAAGASVGLHLLSKKSAGLFRAAIVESGSALNNWTAAENFWLTTRDLVSRLSGDVNLNDSQVLKDFLKSKSTEEIVRAANSQPFHVQYWPVIEPESEDAFLTKSHYELMKSGKFSKVPAIFGIVSEEGLSVLRDLNYAIQMANRFDPEPEKYIISEALHANSSDTDAIIQEIKDIYLRKGETFAQNLTALVKFIGDDQFARGTLKQAEMHSIFAPVYLYQFAYYGERASVPAFIDGAERVAHGQETLYFWKSDNQNPSDILARNRLVKLWSNFAKYLNPTPEASDLFDNVTWPKYKLGTRYYLNINNTMETRTNLKRDAMAAWDEVFDKYGRKPLLTY